MQPLKEAAAVCLMWAYIAFLAAVALKRTALGQPQPFDTDET